MMRLNLFRSTVFLLYMLFLIIKAALLVRELASRSINTVINLPLNRTPLSKTRLISLSFLRPYYSSNSQALSLFVSSAFYYKAAFGRTHLTPEPMFTFAFQIGKFGNTFFHSMSSNFSFYFRT